MRRLFTKKGLQKFFFRWMVVNLVYFAVKLSMENDGKQYEGLFTSTSLFYYVSAFFLLMLTWETNDYLLKKYKKRYGINFKSGLKIVVINMLIMLPVCALTYYVALFPFKEVWGIVCPNPPNQQFAIDFSRAVLIGLAVVFANMFQYALTHNDKLEKQLEDLKKDMVASQYTSLKNQISPHFLFNSLNTLTSLMYEDRDLASDFVTRLASSYRYILDNREHDLVSLKKELEFLDSFIFMMRVRHKEAITINLEIKVSPEKFFIPTLSLQMLVENALKHNVYSKERPLNITISSIQNDALAIHNNFQPRESKEESTQVGIKNIKKRYAFYTNKQVLVRDEDRFFEVIIPLLDKSSIQVNLKAIS